MMIPPTQGAGFLKEANGGASMIVYFRGDVLRERGISPLPLTRPTGIADDMYFIAMLAGGRDYIGDCTAEHLARMLEHTRDVETPLPELLDFVGPGRTPESVEADVRFLRHELAMTLCEPVLCYNNATEIACATPTKHAM
jgi:hypothetical protein